MEDVMIKTTKGGAYLVNGCEIIEDSNDAIKEVSLKTGLNITR